MFISVKVSRKIKITSVFLFFFIFGYKENNFEIKLKWFTDDACVGLYKR